MEIRNIIHVTLPELIAVCMHTIMDNLVSLEVYMKF